MQTRAPYYQGIDLSKQLPGKSKQDDGLEKLFPVAEAQSKQERDERVEAKLPAAEGIRFSSSPTTTTVYMFSDEGGLVAATLDESRVLKAVALCIDAVPVNYSVVVDRILHWSPQRIKFLPELGILSFLHSPTKIILFDVFQKYQHILRNLSVNIYAKDISASKAVLKIDTTEVSSGGLALTFDLRYTFEESWADCLDATSLSQNVKPPSIGLLTTSGSLYRFQLQHDLEVGEPENIYSGLRFKNASEFSSSAQRALEIDGNIFCIGNFVFDQDSAILSKILYL